MTHKPMKRGKKGQAALEFLMTYAWAFLVMIAVIAGIVALDPLGAAQISVNTCQLSQPLSCSSEAMILADEDGDGNFTLTFRVENVGRETIVVQNMSVSGEQGSSVEANETDGDTVQLSPGATVDMDFESVGNALSGNIVSGDQYTFDLDATQYAARVGSAYSQDMEGQVRITAN